MNTWKRINLESTVNFKLLHRPLHRNSRFRLGPITVCVGGISIVVVMLTRTKSCIFVHGILWYYWAWLIIYTLTPQKNCSRPLPGSRSWENKNVEIMCANVPDRRAWRFSYQSCNVSQEEGSSVEKFVDPALLSHLVLPPRLTTEFETFRTAGDPKSDEPPRAHFCITRSSAHYSTLSHENPAEGPNSDWPKFRPEHSY